MRSQRNYTVQADLMMALVAHLATSQPLQPSALWAPVAYVSYSTVPYHTDVTYDSCGVS